MTPSEIFLISASVSFVIAFVGAELGRRMRRQGCAIVTEAQITWVKNNCKPKTLRYETKRAARQAVTKFAHKGKSLREFLCPGCKEYHLAQVPERDKKYIERKKPRRKRRTTNAH